MNTPRLPRGFKPKKRKSKHLIDKQLRLANIADLRNKAIDKATKYSKAIPKKARHICKCGSTRFKTVDKKSLIYACRNCGRKA